MVIFEHGQLITLPAAVTQADQVKGMSGENHSTGLILAWKTAEPRAVWMKDTPTPLTAAFIDRNLNPKKIKKTPQNGCLFNTACVP
ncbi:DUF192 domain-containing protein [Salmonella enterica]|nr:DUF192 domain-containing protein [Salmonella enterica]